MFGQSPYNAWLADFLRPHYTLPHVVAGHEAIHVEGLIAYGPRLLGMVGHEGTELEFDPETYVTACWLHNLDRSKELVKTAGMASVARGLLSTSPYDEETRERIVHVVQTHMKKDDEAGDDPLLTAVRTADKLDRFTPANIFGTGSSLPHLPHFDPKDPWWKGRSTKEKELQTHYGCMFRVLEWYGMLPSDEARELVPNLGLRSQIGHVRMMGMYIAGRLGIKNESENDLKLALGKYYMEVMLRMNDEP